MDALVAKEVMGYSVDFEEDPSAGREANRVWFIVADDDPPNRSTIPKYSTDMEAAWKVAKKIESCGDALSLQHRGTTEGNTGTAIWTAWFGKTVDLAWAGSPSLAICRAALLAFRNRKEQPRKQVAGSPFSAIERELAKVMGPIAATIVDDKIAEFGATRDSFPADRMDSFVKAISEEIADKSERAMFTRAMTELLRQSRNGSKREGSYGQR
ncbi:MAG: BC1872 family protein [Syntrophales bacterium]